MMDGRKRVDVLCYTWMNEIIFQTVAGKYFNITLDFSFLQDYTDISKNGLAPTNVTPLCF